MRQSSIRKAILKGMRALLVLFVAFGLANDVFASSSFFFSQPPKQISEGDRVTIDIRIRSTDQPINAVTGVITFPANLVNAVAFPRDGSIINLWTQEPKAARGRISFEGISFNPGFIGPNGLLFKITFEAKQAGTVNISLSEGAVLANDGRGTNVLTTLASTSFKIVPGRPLPARPTPGLTEFVPTVDERLAALPVIIEYSPLVTAPEGLYLKGKGEPNALTKIVFKDVSAKSLGEKLMEIVQSKRKKLDEVLVSNDVEGGFQYMSPKNIVAGVYNATPFLVDEVTSVEKPGFGVQLLVDDSKIVKALVVLLNVLGLLIPIVVLLVVIYFIPWYSFKRMRVIKKKLGLEEAQMETPKQSFERKDPPSDPPSLQGGIGE